MILIFTANDIARISPYLLDRFDAIINVEGYGRRDKIEIVNTFIVPEINRKYGLSVTIDNEACELLVDEYSFTNGVRDIKRKVYNLTRHLFAEKGTKELHICTSDIKDFFEKPLSRGNVPCDNNESGVALGLAVSGGSEGLVFPVETVIIPNDNTFKVTGLAGEDVTQSAELCATYIRSQYGKLGNGVGIHVHYGEGAIKKSGPSAGVTTFISMLSAAFDIPVSYDYAYTGEIDLKGYVFPIGGEREKIEAACRQGCKTVFLPYENYQKLVDSQSSILDCDISIIPVRHVSEVANIVLPEIQKMTINYK